MALFPKGFASARPWRDPITPDETFSEAGLKPRGPIGNLELIITLVRWSSALALLTLLTSCAALQAALLPDDLKSFLGGEQSVEQGGPDEDPRRALQDLYRRLGGRLAARPWLDLARSAFDGEEYSKAREEYLRFLDLFPRHPLAHEAHYYLGLSYFKEMRDVDRDQTYTRKALDHFEAVLEKPDSPYAEEVRTKVAHCRRRLAEKELYVGTFYLKRGRYAAALGRFETLLNDYDGVGLDDQALFYKGEALRRLKRDEEAQAAFRRLLHKHRGSSFAREAAGRLGVTPPANGAWSGVANHPEG